MTLVLSDLSVWRGRRQVLAPVNLCLPRGCVAGVVGPNGAGKSTLLSAVAGLLPAGGSVRWQERALSPQEVGFLPQAFAVRSRLTVLECLLLGLREGLGWRIRPEQVSAAERMLARLGLAPLANRPMEALSGGQQQLVLLAQRLLRRPVLLILDEPTSALDLHHQLQVLRHVRDHAEETGGVVLVAIHDLTMAARFCDRLLLVEDGHLSAAGPPAQVLNEAQVARVWRIGAEILTSREGRPVIVPH
ncbi:ABC transporter ATP-binding protein [Cereibacter sediminicola]|uniref:ABC transporter ATP-binding protein n=1 Tax=Cereibacter sediminicola TaxID=2584941 RepID=UPI0011A06C5A|nr:ABC transporter ATP-binding protein [Cereibacter sediminicola]